MPPTSCATRPTWASTPRLATEAVASGAGREQVVAELEAAAERQITGVPAFVIDDVHLIPGAQDVETMRLMLTRIHAKAQKSPADLRR